MTDTRMTKISKARFAGLACMIGGMMFSLYFIGLNLLLELLLPPLELGVTPAVKAAIWCATSVCLAGGPLGLLALGATGTGWKKAIGVIGATVTLLGLASYFVGSIYVYNFPGRAQLFTPGGSALITLGMLIMATAVLKAKELRGWRAVTPLLMGLYFPLQFPLQAIFFLGKGRGPNPLLLGAWGLFWLLLSHAIRSGPRPKRDQFTPVWGIKR